MQKPARLSELERLEAIGVLRPEQHAELLELRGIAAEWNTDRFHHLEWNEFLLHWMSDTLDMARKSDEPRRVFVSKDNGSLAILLKQGLNKATPRERNRAMELLAFYAWLPIPAWVLVAVSLALGWTTFRLIETRHALRRYEFPGYFRRL